MSGVCNPARSFAPSTVCPYPGRPGAPRKPLRRPRYASEAQRALRYAFADALNRPAARVTRAEVANTLDVLAKAGEAAMAGRTPAYGRACYRWAEKHEKVPGNPFASLPNPAGATERERVLTDEEIGRVWNATAGMSYPWGPLFRLLLLTVARRDEVAGMRWSEISADLKTWAIPSARMKRGLPHVVALATQARDVLELIPRIEGQDLVFSTTGCTAVSGFTQAKVALDRASAVTDWRLHDNGLISQLWRTVRLDIRRPPDPALGLTRIAA